MIMKKSESHPHIVSLRVYLMVGLALYILTAVTVRVSLIPLGGLNVVVAVTIAAIKATLVVLFFMHLLYDNKMYALVFLVAILFLAFFIMLTMFDVVTRDEMDELQLKPIEEKAAIYRKADTTLVDSMGVELEGDTASHSGH
jgi:cytochrome c oxidase subunit 4